MTAGYVDPNALNIAHGDLSKRKKVQERASLQRFSIGLNNTTNSIKQSIRWQRVKWDLVKLYPNIIFDKNNNPNRSPTPEEVALACKIVNDEFFLLYKGRSAVRDPQDKNSIIAVIEFTQWGKLSDEDKKDLEFVSTFLHGSKRSINSVSSLN
ncbi:hypothetical protein MJO29_002869 [Puccinia striiformis f. sp. tritici]|nr:hypothetical protein MJO29_002869 [Puccinia striiformis f. sp. tritici]